MAYLPLSMRAAIAAAARTLADGLLLLLKPEEKASAEADPGLSASRFWVVGQSEPGGGSTVIAWSELVSVAMLLGRFASDAGVEAVSVVDTETNVVLEHRRAG